MDNLHTLEFVSSPTQGPDLVVTTVSHASPLLVTRYLDAKQVYVRCPQANVGKPRPAPGVSGLPRRSVGLDLGEGDGTHAAGLGVLAATAIEGDLAQQQAPGAGRHGLTLGAQAGPGGAVA